MELYVIRHAIAEERRDGEDDADRALTTEGIEKMKGIVRGLDRQGVRFDLLLHSPWRRAAETATLLAPQVDGPTQICDALAGPPTEFLLDACTAERVAVVGHQPWLGELVCWLTFGQPLSEAIQLRKGGVAWLSGDPTPRGMCLRALWTPGSLRGR